MVDIWGTGKKDFSQNIETSVIAIPHTHQYRVSTYMEQDLGVYDWLTIDLGELFSVYVGTVNGNLPAHNYMMYDCEIFYDANVLIKACYGKCDINGTLKDPEYGWKWGYGHVSFKFPKGFLLPKADFDEGWFPFLGYLPGGYTVRFNSTFIVDSLKEEGGIV